MRVLLAVLAAFFACATAEAQTHPLEGVWAAEYVASPVARGPLTITREGSNWRAEFSGAGLNFQVRDNEVRFSFPDNTGAFRGRLTRGGGAMEGFWIKPAAAGEAAPGSMQAFATPVVLTRMRANQWRADIEPLDHRVRFYLRVFRRAEDDVLVGAFRNPEFNANFGASHFRVTQDGDAVRFRARYDDNAPEFGPDAVMLTDPDRLRMDVDGLGITIEFERRALEQVADFFPRPPGSSAYVYTPPPETGDGWRTARASATGIDESALTRVVQTIAESDPAARRPSLIHSILIAHRGRLVLEEYFYGYGRDTPHDTRSAGKTFSSILLGAAMRQRLEISPETAIYPLLSERGPFANPDPRKDQITLAHLMTHTSGLDCDDNAEASPGNEGVMQTQREQPDWWRYTLDLPMAHDPGARYAYCSANTNLMGAALTTATHTWLPEYFDRTIARPLQFGAYHWNLMPTGEGYLGGGAFLRPRDLLKVGQMYLDGGVWRGRRIVDASWVTHSTEARLRITPETTGLTPEQFGNYYGEADEALAWHLGEITAGVRTYRTYMATGNGGQVLLVVPEAELVAVFTGGNFGQGGIWTRWGNEIIGAQIIPAITPR